MIQINGFYQSKKLDPQEQQYYTAARHFLKDNGMYKFFEYMQVAERYQPEDLIITSEQFLFVLRMAYNDYTEIIFNPSTFKNDNDKKRN